MPSETKESSKIKTKGTGEKPEVTTINKKEGLVIMKAKSSEPCINLEKPIKHPLQHAWTFWYFANDNLKNWEDNLYKVASLHMYFCCNKMITFVSRLLQLSLWKISGRFITTWRSLQDCVTGVTTPCSRRESHPNGKIELTKQEDDG